MILTNKELKKELSNYSNINAKISRLLKENKLFSLKKGLYETNKDVSSYLLANYIYPNSYLTFDFALYYYDLIPEFIINTYTSAALKLNKKKVIHNQFGYYIYRFLPASAFLQGINKVKIIFKDEEYDLFIASKEKAIVDKLYICPIVSNIAELEFLLFEDLRIDTFDFYDLNRDKLILYAKDFPSSTNLKLFIKFLNKRRIIDEFKNNSKTFKIY